MLSSRASPPPGGRERDLLFGRNSVLPILGDLPFRVGRDFVEICVRGGALKRACLLALSLEGSPEGPAMRFARPQVLSHA